MQGNSLIESFQGVDLSELTYKRESKKDHGEVMLFDDEKNRLQKTVSQLLSSYYSWSEHEKKLRLRKQISDAINQQLEAQFVNSSILTKLKDIDLAGNSQFFLWHTWFSDVFNREDGKSGFDIVIGNPPYISNKGINEEDKDIYVNELGFTDDMYNMFTFKGISLCREFGVLTYIIPKTFWTIQTKKNMREMLLSNTIDYIFDTANPFETAMVDTCILQVKRQAMPLNWEIKFIDGTENLSKPKLLGLVSQSVYLNTQNSIIFKPTEYNLKLYKLLGKQGKELYDKWWNAIKTSRDIEKNRSKLVKYHSSLKPGDIALLGCLTDGGQGLATANNGKYIAVRSSTKWADKIIESRPKKLVEARKKKKIEILGLQNFNSEKDFLNSLTETEIVDLFDKIKEKYGRDIFGQGYIYRIIRDQDLANVENLTKDEKENGIDVSNKHHVPYDKGDKDGNRWYLESPFAIAWSKENVHYLKTDPKARYQGYSFYFREGFCWNNVLNPQARLLKVKLKGESVNDVGSMSLYPNNDVINSKYCIALLNSNLIFDYYRVFINCTVNIQINDLRQLPIIIPSEQEMDEIVSLVDKAIEIKKKESIGIFSESVSKDLLFDIEEQIDRLINKLYGME